MQIEQSGFVATQGIVIGQPAVETVRDVLNECLPITDEIHTLLRYMSGQDDPETPGGEYPMMGAVEAASVLRTRLQELREKAVVLKSRLGQL